MRVLHIVNSLEPGGMENGVINLAHGLEPRGVETHVACLQIRGAFAERLPEPERARALGKTTGFSPKIAWALGGQIARLQPDLLHTHNLGPLIYAALASLGGRLCPILHGEHSQLTSEERQPRRLRQRRWLYRTCRHVHTVSTGIYDQLVHEGFPTEHLSVITNGVDTERFRPGDRGTARQEFDLPSHALCIGLVGRYGPFKRHDCLIEAFEQIADKLPAAYLIFAGAGGSEEARIHARVQASPFAARIRLPGLQRRPERLYQALDLLVIPSTNEGLSNVALEAMACGLPVLANTGCGHEQMIRCNENGRIADLRSAEDLARELFDLLQAPKRLAEWAHQARQDVESRFSIARMLAAYEHCYRSLAKA